MMGFLAGVHSLVNGQGRSLDELLVTLGIVTDMGSNTCVDTLYIMNMLEGTFLEFSVSISAGLTMTGKVASSCEAFATSAAGICFNGSRWGLLLRWLLWDMVHSHAGHTTHARHVGEAAHLHRTVHRVLNLHRGLHRCRRRVGTR